MGGGAGALGKNSERNENMDPKRSKMHHKRGA
jgi:hypothetical protein